MTATLARRLVKVEAAARQLAEARFEAACRQLRATMDPEHARWTANWLSVHVEGKRPGPCTGGADPNHVCPVCLERFNPPALARAVVRLTVTDSCGDWLTFVGAAAAAAFPRN